MKALVIGLGGAGNKAVQVLEKSGEVECDYFYINSTSIDIPDGVDPKRAIVLSEDPNRGCGKERSIAKGHILNAIKSGKIDFESKVEDKDLIILATATEGGTGSGATPTLGKYCEQVLGKNVHIYGFGGFEDDARGLQNTIEFFKELDDEFMVHMIQNSAFLGEAKGNHFRAEELADREFVNRVKILLGSGMVASSQNIDTTDLYKVINTAGYCTEEKVKVTGDLMDKDDFNKLIRQAIGKSKSIKSGSTGCARMAVILNLTEANEDGVDFSFDEIKQEYGTPYETFVQKQYDGGEEYIAFIVSGMNLPLEEVKAIHSRYMEKSNAVNKKADSFFSEIAGLVGNADDSRFNIGSLERRGPAKSKGDFLSQFEARAVPNGKKG